MKVKKKKLSDIPLEIRAEEALKKAVADTIADHKRTGDPIVIWRDGRVVKIPADQIEVREAQTEYSMSTKGKSSQRPSVHPGDDLGPDTLASVFKQA